METADKFKQRFWQRWPMPQNRRRTDKERKIHAVPQAISVKKFGGRKTNIGIAYFQQLLLVLAARERNRVVQVERRLDSARRTRTVEPEGRLIRGNFDRHE